MGQPFLRQDGGVCETGRASGKEVRNVILILADMVTPPLPYLCAPSDIEQERSLGSILAASHVTENLIKKNCMFYRKNDYLSMVGMLKGENVFTLIRR